MAIEEIELFDPEEPGQDVKKEETPTPQEDDECPFGSVNPAEAAPALEESAETGESKPVEENVVKEEETVPPVENETPVNEEPVKDEVAEEIKEEVKEASFLEYEKFETLLLNYFQGMKTMISSLNQKDKNILDLSKELSDYRNGLEKSLFKSLASYLIGFRESLVKQNDDLKKYDYDLATLKDYFSMFADSFEGLLQDIQLVEEPDGTFTYNGKNIFASKAAPSFETTLPLATDIEIEKPTFHSMEDIEAYMNDVNGKLLGLLKEKEVTDALVSQAIKLNASVKNQECQVILYPVLRKLLRLKNEIQAQIDLIKEEEDKDTYVKLFKRALDRLTFEMDEILFECGISVESMPEIDSAYDTKTQMSLGYVNVGEDKQELHGKVAEAISPAYVFDGKVLKRAKVKIYRLVK